MHCILEKTGYQAKAIKGFNVSFFDRFWLSLPDFPGDKFLTMLLLLQESLEYIERQYKYIQTLNAITDEIQRNFDDIHYKIQGQIASSLQSLDQENAKKVKRETFECSEICNAHALTPMETLVKGEIVRADIEDDDPWPIIADDITKEQEEEKYIPEISFTEAVPQENNHLYTNGNNRFCTTCSQRTICKNKASQTMITDSSLNAIVSTGAKIMLNKETDCNGLHGKCHCVTHVCEYCGKKFSKKDAMLRHLVVHTGEKRIECEYCKKKFARIDNYKLHVLIHTGAHPHKCTLCPRKFGQPGLLERHMCTHTGEGRFKCEFCERAFASNSQLIQHRWTHTKKPFKCDKCNCYYANNGNLTRHMLVHTGLKRYECNVCGKRFPDRAHRNIHMATHTAERPFECHLCDKKFVIQKYLNKHVARVHHKTKPTFTCKICRKIFKRDYFYQKHVLSHKDDEVP